MTLDESLSETIRSDYRDADISPEDRAMLDYADKLTRTPWKMTEDDVVTLRNHGFNDMAILQINLIASWFNYVNRVADGLGVGKMRSVDCEHNPNGFTD